MMGRRSFLVGVRSFAEPLAVAGFFVVMALASRADTGFDTPSITPCGPTPSVYGLMQPPADPSQYWRVPDVPAPIDVRALPPSGGGHVHHPEQPPPVPLGSTLGFSMLGLSAFTLLAWLTRRGRRHG